MSLAAVRAQSRKECTMQDFDARMAKIRQRFATALESEINENFALMPRLANEGPEAVAFVDSVYRRHAAEGGPVVSPIGQTRH